METKKTKKKKPVLLGEADATAFVRGLQTVGLTMLEQLGIISMASNGIMIQMEPRIMNVFIGRIKWTPEAEIYLEEQIAALKGHVGIKQ